MNFPMFHMEKKFFKVRITNTEIEKEYLTPFQNQLKKLIRKFLFFFEIYKNITNEDNIQIVFCMIWSTLII